MRSVIFDGARPITGSHLRSSAGSCRSIDCRARSSDCSFQLKAPRMTDALPNWKELRRELNTCTIFEVPQVRG